MPIIPAFQLNLNNAILQGLACVGKYDAKHPNLTCATSGGQVFIHDPHNREGTDASGVRFLSINRKITSLEAGNFSADEGAADTLLVGTQTNLLAYDVEANSDSFYKDVPDGVNAMVLGWMSGVDTPLAIVGGNCSIQGFDGEGSELYWTVCGDNVGALTFCDVMGRGGAQLVVGSDDFDVRVYEAEDMLLELTETDKPLALTPMTGSRFAYVLANGTVGLYERSSRVWRVKSKTQACCASGYDLDADGVLEVVSGWASGKVEARNEATGELVYKDMVSSPVSAMVKADYRLDGRDVLICCALDGEVRGYLPTESTEPAAVREARADDRELKKLRARTAELNMELKSLTTSLESAKTGEATVGGIPPTTRVNLRVEMDDARGLILVLSTNNDSIIRTALVFSIDGSIFDRESLMVYPSMPSTSLHIVLGPKKNVRAELSIQALVGARGSSTHYHVFELSHILPKFCMYQHVADNFEVPDPESSTRFYVTERIARFVMWINQSFPVELSEARGVESLSIAFRSIRDGSILKFKISSDGGGKVEILGDDMDVVAEVVQDMCSYLGIQELESVAEFPREMDKFRAVLVKVDEHNAIRLKFTAEMADSSNMVKTLVIKAEDARIRGDLDMMLRIYSELFALNNELIGEYMKRCNNHEELLEALKEVNHMIQRAAKLRVGPPKARVVSACRAAIKSNNVQSLFQIISQGRAPAS